MYISYWNLQVYETLTGVKVEGKHHALSKKIVLDSLPPEWPTDPIEDIISLNQKSSKTLVVLDDDPTGTQTVHGLDVLAEWWVTTTYNVYSHMYINNESDSQLVNEQ